jgi:hypothetical protein
VNITCRISLASLLPLTKVILSARTSQGYEFASSNPTLFKEWLFSKKPILRNGFTYRFLPPHEESNVRDVFHEYSVIFSEPLSQGYALPSTTEVLVSLYRNTQPHQRTPERSEENYEGEHIEIDQNFMANSVLPQISFVQYSISCPSTHTSVLQIPTRPPGSVNSPLLMVHAAESPHRTTTLHYWSLRISTRSD